MFRRTFAAAATGLSPESLGILTWHSPPLAPFAAVSMFPLWTAEKSVPCLQSVRLDVLVRDRRRDRCRCGAGNDRIRRRHAVRSRSPEIPPGSDCDVGALIGGPTAFARCPLRRSWLATSPPRQWSSRYSERRSSPESWGSHRLLIGVAIGRLARPRRSVSVVSPHQSFGQFVREAVAARRDPLRSASQWRLHWCSCSAGC